MVVTNTLNVFVKQKYARLGLLSISTRRGKTVFTPSSPFPGDAPYAPVADSKPQGVIPSLGELRPRSRSAELALMLERELTPPINQLLSSHILAIMLKK